MNRLACLALALLSGCVTTYDLRLLSRAGADTGVGRIENAGAATGPITVNLGGRIYQGTWAATRDEAHGFVTGFGSRFARASTLSAYSSIQRGLALLHAPNAQTLRCQFQADGYAGFGECEDGQGKKYDLQLLPPQQR